MRQPLITVAHHDLPRHDISRRPQVPAEITTLLRVLCLPEDPAVSTILYNYLLDSESAERKILVEVRPSLTCLCQCRKEAPASITPPLTACCLFETATASCDSLEIT
jgi:hypothetical protein